MSTMDESDSNLDAEPETIDISSPIAFETVEFPRIDGYQFISKLGEGGMGAVFLAEQSGELKRFVAIKLIKTRFAGQDVISRFHAERRVLALMDHPNIANIFDAGTSQEGLPFFAMEYVEGKPIDLYCDQSHLTLQERLRLALQICDGIHHAHQKGILHRDIKASNVLIKEIEGKPVPKIIDFGIAKIVQNTVIKAELETKHNQMIGTPEYMSPEQAMTGSTDIDVRSDVYSLGVLLFLLITGELPFTRKSSGPMSSYELLAKIVSEEPSTMKSHLAGMGSKAHEIASLRNTSLRRLQKTLGSDLQWIIGKCLEKKREHRYASVPELSRDIRAFLNHEPILANSPSPFHRFIKWSMRNRAAALSGTLVFIALVFGISGTTIGMLKAKHAEQQTRQQMLKTKQAEKLATQQRDLALNSFFFLVREVDHKLESRPDLTQLRFSLLDGALTGLKELTELSGHDFRADQQIVTAHNLLAQIYSESRNLKEAEKHLKLAITMGKELRDNDPGNEEICLMLTKLYKTAANAYSNYRLGNLDISLEFITKALANLESANPTFRDSPQVQVLFSECYRDRGYIQFDLGNIQKARESFEQSLASIQPLIDLNMDIPGVAFIVPENYLGLGDVYWQSGDDEKTEYYFQEALNQLETKKNQVKDLPLTQRRVALANFSMGDLYLKQDKLDKAAQHYDLAESIQRDLLLLDPKNSSWYRDLLTTVFRQGDLEKRQEKWAPALERFMQAEEMARQLLVENPGNQEAHRDRFICNLRLGDLYLKKGSFQEAEECYQTALKETTSLHQASPENAGVAVDVVISLSKLGDFFYERVRFHEAAAYYKKALQKLEEIKGKGLIDAQSPYMEWFQMFLEEIEECSKKELEVKDTPTK